MAEAQDNIKTLLNDYNRHNEQPRVIRRPHTRGRISEFTTDYLFGRAEDYPTFPLRHGIITYLSMPKDKGSVIYMVAYLSISIAESHMITENETLGYLNGQYEATFMAPGGPIQKPPKRIQAVPGVLSSDRIYLGWDFYGKSLAPQRGQVAQWLDDMSRSLNEANSDA